MTKARDFERTLARIAQEHLDLRMLRARCCGQPEAMIPAGRWMLIVPDPLGYERHAKYEVRRGKAAETLIQTFIVRDVEPPPTLDGDWTITLDAPLEADLWSSDWIFREGDV